jgi:hypothetical protein
VEDVAGTVGTLVMWAGVKNLCQGANRMFGIRLLRVEKIAVRAPSSVPESLGQVPGGFAKVQHAGGKVLALEQLIT